MKDQRALPRYPVQIAGKLMAPDMSFCVDVVIKDLSEGGALLTALQPASQVPDRAYLWQAQTRTLFECTVRWRKNNQLLGVQFTDTSSRGRMRQLIDAVVPHRRRAFQPRSSVMHCSDNAA
jgi:PilZ domain-containing protein